MCVCSCVCNKFKEAHDSVCVIGSYRLTFVCVIGSYRLMFVCVIGS